jgi:hypothetical protein
MKNVDEKMLATLPKNADGKMLAKLSKNVEEKMLTLPKNVGNSCGKY